VTSSPVAANVLVLDVAVFAVAGPAGGTAPGAPGSTRFTTLVARRQR
jgi:hypothetical protein